MEYLATPHLTTNVCPGRLETDTYQWFIHYKDFTSLLDVVQQQTVDGTFQH